MTKTESAMDREPHTTREPSALPAAGLAALQQGNKIEAIKIVRQVGNLGLKEAKDAVDDHIASHPALQSALAQTQREGRRSALASVITLIAAAIAAYFFLR